MAEKKSEKKPTEYVVLRSETAMGPYDVVGSHTTHGQLAAKRAAATADVGSEHDPEQWYYVAVPASSFVPQKPQVQMTITFLSDDGSEEQIEEEVEEEEEGKDDEDVVEVAVDVVDELTDDAADVFDKLVSEAPVSPATSAAPLGGKAA